MELATDSPGATSLSTELDQDKGHASGPVGAARNCREELALRSGYGLTEREATIARLLCLGYAPAKLASKLNLSTHTVRSHLKRIFTKTRTHRQADLIRLLLTTVFAAPNCD